MAVQCNLCGKSKGIFGPSMYQCTSCGTVICSNCMDRKLKRLGVLDGRRPICPRCGNSQWHTV